MAGGAEHPQKLAEADFGRHCDDIGARHHDVVDTAGAQGEDVLQHRPFLRQEIVPGGGSLRQHILQVAADRCGSAQAQTCQ